MIFLDLHITLLRYFGVFPPKTSSKIILFTFYVYRTFIFVLITYFTVTMAIHMIVTNDLASLARTIDLWTMFLSGLYKWCYITLFNKDFVKLNHNLAQLQHLGSISYGRSADRFTINYLKQTRTITLCYVFSGFLGAIFFIINPLVTYPQGDRSDFEYFNDSNSYPLGCWIFFKINNFWMFTAIFAFYSFMTCIIAVLYLSIDSFMFATIYSAGRQIELLHLSFNKITNSMTKFDMSTKPNQFSKYTEKQQNLCSANIRKCIKHHISILKYIQDLRTLFSSLIITDYLHGITSVSFALIQLTISDTVSESMTVFSFILLSCSHQFLNNYFGEYIVQKQLLVGSVVNQIPWWRANKEIRNMLLLIILRSQNPILIRGFYMYKLRYASFLSFMKSLYTYYMVLRRLAYENKTP